MSTTLTSPASPSPAPTPARADADDPGRDRRRLALHLVALGALLMALVPVVGTNSVWSADEGAMLHQATHLLRDGRWALAHPFPAADPDGVWYPVHLAAFADGGGYVVLGKHVPVVWLLGWLHRLGGYPATLVASAALGLVAAASSARLAARIDRRAALPALWLTGAASPLFLAGYVAWAHTLGAALVGWGLVGLTADRRGPAQRIGLTPARVAGAVALASSCLVRTEATLAAAAITGALVLVGAARRDPVERWLGPGVLAGVATVSGFLVDRATAVATIGPVDPTGRSDAWGGVTGRLEGFLRTWLRPGFSDQPEQLLFLASATLVIAAAILARSHGLPHPPVRTAGSVAALLIVLRFLVSPGALIPGLVVAFPILFAGLVLLRRADLARPEVSVPAVAVVLYWLAVLATQYRYGGVGEWGGRYFALGLPAAVAIATPPLLRALEPLGRDARRRFLAVGTVIVLLPPAMGIIGMRWSRDQTRALTDRVQAALVEPGDGGSPVVVSAMAPVGRWSWDRLDEGRWLLVPAEDLPEVGDRLAAIGIERFVFVSDRAEDEAIGLGPDWRVLPRPAEAGATPFDQVVVTVERARP